MRFCKMKYTRTRKAELNIVMYMMIYFKLMLYHKIYYFSRINLFELKIGKGLRNILHENFMKLIKTLFWGLSVIW